MLIVSICGFIGLLIGLFKVKDYIFALTNIGILIGGLVAFALTPVMTARAPVENKVVEKEIYALNDTSTNQGVCYLFSGYVDDELKYIYAVDTSNGKQVKETKTTNVFIKEENCGPKVKIYKRVLKNKIYGWLFFVELPDEDKVEFYVSRNTVTNDYKIDLQ